MSGKVQAGNNEKVAGPWNRFSREVVMAPSLSEFKERLDMCLVLDNSAISREIGLDDLYECPPN